MLGLDLRGVRDAATKIKAAFVVRGMLGYMLGVILCALLGANRSLEAFD